MEANAVAKITPEEFLERERAAEFRHEYYRGEVIAMAGGSPSHSAIGTNLLHRLAAALSGGGCRPYNGELMIRTPDSTVYAYPDVSIFCGPLQVDPKNKYVALNPSVVIEILSPSTEVFDRGRKGASFRTIQTLQHYVLVAQDAPLIELLTRTADGWKLTDIAGLESVMSLAALGIEIPLSQIYADVTFPT